MTATPPNWYPDPSDPARIRWWDGARWTEHTQPYEAPAAAVTPEPQAEPDVPAEMAPVLIEEVQPSVIGAVPAFDNTWLTQGFDDDLAVNVDESPLGDQVPAAAKRSVVPWIVGVGAILLVGGGLVLWVTSTDDDNNAVVTQPSVTTRPPIATLPATSTVSVTTTTRPPVTGSTPSSAPTTEVTTTSRPGSTTSLANAVVISDAAFRMSASSRWEETRAAGLARAWFTGGQSPAYRDNVNVVVERLPADLSLQEYVAASIRNAPSAVPTFVEIGNSVIDVNGKKLGQIDFRQTQGGLTLRHRAIISVKGRTAITVTFTTQPERFEADVPGIMQYLTTVEAL